MLAENLYALRRSRGLTQKSLADRLGVKKQSVSNWENSNIMPSVEMLEKIADFFAVSTDYLLGRKAEEERAQYLDITGLAPEVAEHVRQLVDDLRGRKP